MAFVGRARDIVTVAPAEEPRVVAEDRLDARLGWDRVIRSLDSTPRRTVLQALVGARGGGHLRSALAEVLPDERAAGTPLHLLLDDLSGASLIAGWAWSRWSSDWMYGGAAADSNRPQRPARRMENICAGFRSGSSALAADGSASPAQNCCPVVPLPHPEDPSGWHPLPEHSEVAMRRARRMDVWIADDGRVHVEAGFQDSATEPGGGRVAVHEYSIVLEADSEAERVERLTARPHVLPYPECSAAASNAERLHQVSVAELRTRVIESLPGTLGCTHLNDALRALADLPALLGILRRELAR